MPIPFPAGAGAGAGAGAAAAGGVVGSTVLSGLASAGIGAAINVGLLFLNRWLNPRPDAPAVEFEINPSVVPARYLFGRQRTSGVPFYWGVKGGYVYIAIAISEGECEQIERIYINGDRVLYRRIQNDFTLNTGEDQTGITLGAARGNKGDILLPVANSPKWNNSRQHPIWEIYEYFKADGTQGQDLQDFAPEPANNYIQGPDGRFYKSGTPEYNEKIVQGDPEFVTEVQGTQTNPDGSAVIDASQVEAIRAWETALPVWSAAHKMNGISWILARFHQPAVKDANDRIFHRVPELSLVVKGMKISFPSPEAPSPPVSVWAASVADYENVYGVWFNVSQGTSGGQNFKIWNFIDVPYEDATLLHLREFPNDTYAIAISGTLSNINRDELGIVIRNPGGQTIVATLRDDTSSPYRLDADAEAFLTNQTGILHFAFVRRDENFDAVNLTVRHPVEDSSTPEWTDNAAAIRYWWETQRRGRPASMIDLPSFRTAYARCDGEFTPTLPSAYSAYQGTSRRYTANGIIESGENVYEIESQLDLCWQGFVVESNEKLYFRPGIPHSSRVVKSAITDDDIISVDSVIPYPPLQERVNILAGRLRQNVAQDYDVLDLIPFRDEAKIALDGQERELPVEYRFVREPITGGRLSAQQIRRLRERKSITITVLPGPNLERHAIIPTDMVTLINKENGYATATNMQVDQRTINLDDSVTLALRVILNDTYADTLWLPPLVDEKLTFPNSERVPDVESLTATDDVRIASDGTTIPIVRLSWDQANVLLTQIQVDGRDAGQAFENSFVLTGLVPGRSYTIRARHNLAGGRVGEWSSLVHTIGNDTAAPGDITGVNLTALAAGLSVDWTNPGDNDLSHINIFVGTAADPPKIAEVFATRHVVFDLQPETEYNVRLQPVDRSGNPGNKTTVASVTTLAEISGPDTRTPNVPIIRVFGKGVGGDGIYIIGVGITPPTGHIPFSNLDSCQIQMAPHDTAWTEAGGFQMDKVLRTTEGNQTDVIDFIVTQYGEYDFTGRVRNPSASETKWSPWSAVMSFTTEPGTEDDSVSSRPILEITRPELEGEVTQITIRRPQLNSKTVFLYRIQVSEKQFVSDERFTTQLRDVAERGSGIATIGGSTFTDSSASWEVDEHKGRVLFIYRWINNDDGSIGFPLANTILSNTATTITIEPGNPYRLPADAVAPIDDDDRRFDYIISESLGSAAWLQTPDDLLLYRDVIAASPGVRSNNPAPVETRITLSIPKNALVRASALNYFGFGPWSDDEEVISPDGVPGTPEPVGDTPNHPDIRFRWPEVIGAAGYEWGWNFYRLNGSILTPTQSGFGTGKPDPTGILDADSEREVVIEFPSRNYNAGTTFQNNEVLIRRNTVIYFRIRTISEGGINSDWGYAPLVAMVGDSMDTALTPPIITASESGGSITLTDPTSTGQFAAGRLSFDGDPTSFSDEFQNWGGIRTVGNLVTGRTYYWECRICDPDDRPFSSSVFISHVAGQVTQTTTPAPTGLALDLTGGVLISTWDNNNAIDFWEWDLQGVFGTVPDWKRIDEPIVTNGSIRNGIPYRFYLRAVIGSVRSTIVSANLTASGIQQVQQVLPTAAPPTPTSLSLSQRTYSFGGSQVDFISLGAKWSGSSLADRYNFSWSGIDAGGLTKRPSLSGSTTRQRWGIFVHKTRNTGNSATFTVEAENSKGKSGSISKSITMG